MLRLAKYLAILAVIIFVAAFLYLNTIFKTAAERIASQMMGTKVSITYATVSPFSGNILVKGLDVDNPKGFTAKHAIEFSSISASVNMASIFTDTIKIKRVDLKDPVIYYEIGLGGDNIRRLLSNMKTAPADSGASADKTPATKKRVIVEDLYLTNCKAKLAADFFGAKAGTEFDLDNVHLQNLGAENGGTSVQNITGMLLQRIVRNLAQLKTSDILNQVKGVNAKSVGDSIKKLF